MTISPTAPLDQLMRVHPLTQGQYGWESPDLWQQGRGAFGGLSMGAMVRALESHVGDSTMALRTMGSTMSAPIMPGAATIEVRTLREGSSTLTVTASLIQDGDLKNHATAVFGQARRIELEDWSRLEHPKWGDWRAQDPAPLGPPLGPVFSQHMEFRPHDGMPFSMAENPRTEGWIRSKQPGQARDNAYLACLADAWWPVTYVQLSMPRPMATIHFNMQFVANWEGLDADAPLFHESFSPVAQDGYTVEFRRLWGEDGRLMALNQQTIVIIK